MPRRLPPLSTLRAFEAAARHLSFKHAANELLVTAGAISQHVKCLEETLGVRLFLRGHKSLQLTAAGHAYFPVVRDAFRMMLEATERIFPRYSPNILMVGVQTSFAVKWLFSRLALFTDENPGIDIRISSSIELDDLAAGRVDAVIRYGPAHATGVQSFHVLAAQLHPVCNPALLVGKAPLVQPQDLYQHTLIHDEFKQGWRTWFSAQGLQHLDTSKGPTFTDESLALQAAIEGVGIALGRSPLIDDDIMEGRLIVPFKKQAIEGEGYYLVCLDGNADRKDIAALRRWITSNASKTRSDAVEGGMRINTIAARRATSMQNMTS
jgi:LysR family glycine cleavage system transcriptional activator